MIEFRKENDQFTDWFLAELERIDHEMVSRGGLPSTDLMNRSLLMHQILKDYLRERGKEC